MLSQVGHFFGTCRRVAVVIVFVLASIATGTAHANELSTLPIDQGEPSGAGFIGKPVSLLTGAETFVRTDLKLGQFFPIVLQRRYHSGAVHDSPLGYGWAHSYDRHLHEFTGGAVEIHKETGWKRRFELSDGAYVTPPGEFGTLVKAGNAFTYTLKDGSREEYNTLGQLAQIVKPGGTPLLILTYGAPLPSGNRLTKVAEHIRQSDNTVPTGVFIDFIYNETTGRLDYVLDSLGRTVDYTQVGDNLTGVSGPGLSSSYGYTDMSYPHALTNISEGKGEYVNSYDTQGRVESQTHGTGVINIEYLIAGQKTKVTTMIKDSAGNPLNTQTRIVEFDSYGQPAIVTDTFGHQIRSTRDPQGLVTSEEFWENGGTVPKSANYYTYDGQGNLLSKSETDGNEVELRLTTWTYHATFGTVLTETMKSVFNSAQNKVTRHFYDSTTGKRTATTETGLLGSGATYNIMTSYSYNSHGQLIGIDGPRSNATDTIALSYDSAGNLTGITPYLSGTITLANHDGLGNPRTVTDPNGAITRYTYDAVGRVLTVQAPGNTQLTTLTYVDAGCGSCGASRSEIDIITLPDGTSLDFDYDDYGHVSRIADGLGNSINYTYDSQGNRLSEQVRDPQNVLQKSLTFQYDALNRLARITNPDSSFAEFGYDSRGRRVSLEDPKENTTTFQYDDLHQLTASTQPGAITTSFAYDGQGHLKSVTDGNGNETRYEYDDLGRLYRTISPDSGTTTYAYDAADNLVFKIDAKNVTIAYQYDAENRLTKIDFPNDTDVLYAYDTCPNGKGRLCTVTDQSGTTAYEYTVRGQVAKETRTILGLPYVTQYAYNSNGNLTTTTYPSGRVVTTSYANNRPISVASNGVPVASNITYKPFGGITSLVYGNGLTGAVTYDNQYRISGISAGTVLDFDYTGYDANGNITAIANAHDATRNKSFVYDDLDRLTNESTVLGSHSFDYDHVGNRLNQNAIIYTYVPGSNRLSSVGGTAYTYDNNGNILNDGVRTYDYNDGQRLEQITKGTDNTVYSYNGLGQRVQKVVNGVPAIYHYDLAGQLIAETNAAGATVVEYVYLNGQPLATLRSGATYWYHNDHLGTPQKVTDSLKNVVWNVDYWAFGTVVNAGTNTVGNRLRLPGQVADAESGLYYNYFRDYNPVTGRYVEADPIGLAGGINPYAYVQNNPVNWIDPWGLEVVFSRTGESVRYAYDRIKQTTRGREIAKRLEGSSQTYRIHVLPGSKGVGNYSDRKYTVLLPEVFTNADLMANLAHELGHAYQDDMGQPIEETPNILDNENPIRSELGYPKRCP